MKKHRILFILIGVFAICFIATSIFFALQSISVANQEQEYFDVYRQKAKEYIQTDSEILEKYDDKVSVSFDQSVSYSHSSPKGFFEGVFVDIFAPSVPDTLEEFIAEIDMIKFNVTINGDPYQITFEKNNQGELVVSDLKETRS